MSAVLMLGNPVLQFEKSEDNFIQAKQQQQKSLLGIVVAAACYFEFSKQEITRYHIQLRPQIQQKRMNGPFCTLSKLLMSRISFLS